MRDPVTGYEYPEEWVRKCKDPAELSLAKSGLGVLLADGRVLRRGFTTGTTATAAVKACILSLLNHVDRVEVELNCGLRVEVEAEGDNGIGQAVKYAGDYVTDVTANIELQARYLGEAKMLELQAGEGIGRLSRDTPLYQKGQAAISASAMSQIARNAQIAFSAAGLPGAKVELSAPRGEEVAARTLNPRMGVVGGISILGSTGLVEPWDDHLGQTVMERVRKADKVVLTTGRIGLNHARRMFPRHESILVGVNIEKALQEARGEVVLLGLPALIMKFIDPEVLNGTGAATVEELMQHPEGKAVLERTLDRFKERYPVVGIVVVDRSGRVLGERA
ncbi:MAG: cobalt-precorrin-5B (C(1))-methyltransferase [Methanomassiliicoccales archaeon]